MILAVLEQNMVILFFHLLILNIFYMKDKYHMYFNFCITDRLPFSIRILLESAVRNCDEFQVTKKDVEKILDWENNQMLQEGVEVAFKPARVLLQVKIPQHFTEANHYLVI